MTIDPPPPPPPVRVAPWRRRLKRAGIALGVVLTCAALLCCTGVAYFAYSLYRAPSEQREMTAFAEELCQHLRDGDAEAVYAALSSDARYRYSAQELAAGLAARGRRIAGCKVIKAGYLFLLLAYVVIEDGGARRRTFDLVKEAGEWKVDSDILDDFDSPPRHGGGGGGD